jgi:uncharacterized protein (TIGR03435 family)
MDRTALTLAAVCALTGALAAQQPLTKFDVASIRRTLIEPPTPAARSPLVAQSVAPRFDVASVKRAIPGETGGRVRFLPGGRFVGENVSLEFVIQQVYQLRDFQVVATPTLKAIIRDGYGARYYIEGRGREDSAPDQVREMVKTLLADRFRLRVHDETRDLPVYALVPADGGVKGARATNGKGGGIELVAPGWIRGFGIGGAALARALSDYLDRPVIDQTKLTDVLDFDLTWATIENAAADTPPGCHPSALEMAKRPRYEKTKLSCPSIFTAVREQLGLILDARRAPIPVLVIDTVEYPTPD